MNIKNYFNVKLYLQAIKRLKVVGIISAIFLCLYAIIAPIVTYIDFNNNSYVVEEYSIISDYEAYRYNNIEEAENYTCIDASSSSFCALYMVLYLVVPIMSVIIFNFLTSRNGSDFYHSLPTKRRAIYLSFMGAIATWSLILITIFCFISGITYAFIPITIVNPLNILIYAFNIFISCILMAAGFGLGCCLSGTALSNLITSISILYLPRLFITIFCELISSANPLVSMDGMFVLSRYDCNLLFTGAASPFINDYYWTRNFNNFSHINFSTLYTLILAIIYIVLGCIVYTKRPSETAGKSAISPKLQLTLRLILGYSISFLVVIPLYMHVEFYKQNSNNTNIYPYQDSLYQVGGFTYIFIIYLITFIIMFLYELITTKSTKKAVKSLITAPLIIIANIVTVIILCQINYNSFFYHPDAEDIEYVKFNFDYNLYANTTNKMELGDGYNKYNKYYNDIDTIINRINDIKVTDKDIVTLVSDLIGKSISRTSDKYYSGTYTYYDEYFDQYESSISITICEGLFETERRLFITEDELRSIVKLLNEHYVTKDIYNSFPQADESYVSIVTSPKLTESQTKEVYNAFISDLKNITPLEYLESLYYYNGVCTLILTYYDNGQIYTDVLDITYATPTAMSAFIKYYSNENTDMTLETLYNNLKITGSDCLNFYQLDVFDYGKHSFDRYIVRNNVNEASMKILDMIKSTSDMISKYEYFPENTSFIDWDKYYLCKAYINYDMLNRKDDNGEYLYYFLIEKTNLDQELIKQFNNK